MKSGGNREKTHNATKVGFQEKLLSPVRCMASSCGVPGVRRSQGPSDLRPSGSRVWRVTVGPVQTGPVEDPGENGPRGGQEGLGRKEGGCH